MFFVKRRLCYCIWKVLSQIFKGDRKAIICTSDIYALEVLYYLRGRGIHIPQDAGLMGFDNIEMLKYVEPLINTVSYPVEEIGKEAVKLLVEMFEGNHAAEDIILPHWIAEGGSL